MFRRVSTVMVFAVDPEKSARWWAEILDLELHLDVNGDAVYAWLTVDNVEYGFHPLDDARNPRGGSPVVYWAVDDIEAARDRLLAAGCVHHRGPLRVDDTRQICQIVDPFGTFIGLEGP